jgi:hypothetical protein
LATVGHWQIYDGASGALLMTLPDQSRRVSSMAHCMSTVGARRTCLRPLNRPFPPLPYLAVHAATVAGGVNGPVLTAHMSGHIRAWQAVAPQLLFEWEAHRTAVESIVISHCAAAARRCGSNLNPTRPSSSVHAAGKAFTRRSVEAESTGPAVDRQLCDGPRRWLVPPTAYWSDVRV